MALAPTQQKGIKDFYARNVHYGINCANDTKMEGIGGFDVHTLIHIRGSLCSVLHERVDSCVHALEIVNGFSHTVTDVDGDWCTDSLIAIGDGVTYGDVGSVIFTGIHGRCNTLKAYNTTTHPDPIDVRDLGVNTDGYGIIRVYPKVNFTDSVMTINNHGGARPTDGASTLLTPDILFTFASSEITNLDKLTFVLAKGIYDKDDILRVIQTRNGFTAKVEDSSGVYFINGDDVTYYIKDADLPWITPQDYGAKADGVTDDSNAIAQALASNNEVYFPEGTYALSKQLVLGNNQKVFGAGSEKTTLLFTSNALADGQTYDRGRVVTGISDYLESQTIVHDITLKGMTLTSNYDGQSTSGKTLLLLTNCRDIYIEDVSCIITTDDTYDANAMEVLENGHDITFVNCYFEQGQEVGTGCVEVRNKYSENSSNIKFFNCDFYKVGGVDEIFGIFTETRSGVRSLVDGVLCDSCRFESNPSVNSVNHAYDITVTWGDTKNIIFTNCDFISRDTSVAVIKRLDHSAPNKEQVIFDHCTIKASKDDSYSTRSAIFYTENIANESAGTIQFLNGFIYGTGKILLASSYMSADVINCDVDCYIEGATIKDSTIRTSTRTRIGNGPARFIGCDIHHDSNETSNLIVQASIIKDCIFNDGRAIGIQFTGANRDCIVEGNTFVTNVSIGDYSTSNIAVDIVSNIFKGDMYIASLTSSVIRRYALIDNLVDGNATVGGSSKVTVRRGNSFDGRETPDEQVQKSTMPTASESRLGKVYQYVGETTSNFTNGYFYECTSSGSPAVYAWTRIDTQPSNGSGDLPTGGTTGQILTKRSSADYDVEWSSSGASITRADIDADYEDMGLIHDISEYESLGVVNVKDYGAVGDGVTDDSGALSSAIAVSNVKVIYFPRGKYNLNGSSGTAITWPANVILAGESADFVEILNSNIEAPQGIECRDVTFNGGTTRHLQHDTKEDAINSSLQDNNVILFVTPRSSGAYVTYTRCKFKNADIASLAFWFDDGTVSAVRPLYATVIDNCEFSNLNHCGVYHSCNIYGAKITNNYFHDMGSDTLEVGSYACIRLGDTSNNTPSDVDTCLIANNKFENFQSKYDFVSHGTEWKGIAFNMLMIEALDVIVRDNEFINLLGWGPDREAVYTKARYAEISNNYLENACCGGEGAICCKARHFDHFSDRNVNVHDNTIYGSYGSGITVYGPSSVFNNKIAIDHIARGIRAFGNMTEASAALGTIEITNNNINCNIGNIKFGDETVTYTSQPIISALDYPYKITINDNIVGVTRDDGISSKPPLIQIAALRSEVEIKNNSLDTSYTSANTISLAGSTSGASITTGRNTININIEGNNLPNSNDKPSIYADLSQTNLSSIRKILNISNNFIRTSEGNAINLTGSANGNDILIYRSIYSTDVKSKQVYLKNFKYVYTEDSQYISVANGSNPVPIYKTLDIAPIVAEGEYLVKIATLPTPSATELGNSYLYTGPSDTTTGIIRGGIYRCISDGASTPTYRWLLDSIPLQLLQYVLTNSTSFDEFKALILSA